MTKKKKSKQVNEEAPEPTIGPSITFGNDDNDGEYERGDEISATSDAFKFENPGDKIKFKLLELTTVPTRFQKQTPLARVIDLRDNQEKIFFCGRHLGRLIKNAEVGNNYEAVFTGYQPTVNGQMKIFSMWKVQKKEK